MRQRTPAVLLSIFALLCHGPASFASRPVQTPATADVATGITGGIFGDGSRYNSTSGDGVSCVLQTMGNFALDTRSSTYRGLWLNFSVPVSAGSAPLPWSNPQQFEHPFMSTAVLDPTMSTTLSDGLRSIPVGATDPSRLQVQFTDPQVPNTTFRINFNANSVTDPVWVTRTGTNTWTIYATSGSAHARLISWPTMGRGNAPTTDYGIYDLPFSIQVTSQ